MKNEFIVIAGKNWRFIKQRLSDEMLEGQKTKYTENIEIRLSKDIGLKKGDLVKVTLEKITLEKITNDIDISNKESEVLV